MTGYTDYRRILIVKPSSSGDVIHALLALAALCRGFPIAQMPGWSNDSVPSDAVYCRVLGRPARGIA